MPEADFEVDIKRDRYLVSIDGRLMSQLLEVAQDRQISVELPGLRQISSPNKATTGFISCEYVYI